MINISQSTLVKLSERHKVKEDEIVECFANIEGSYLEDTREDHKSDPVTQWFIAETNYGRKLKIAFMQISSDIITIKTAYEANKEEIRIYKKYGMG